MVHRNDSPHDSQDIELEVREPLNPNNQNNGPVDLMADLVKALENLEHLNQHHHRQQQQQQQNEGHGDQVVIDSEALDTEIATLAKSVTEENLIEKFIRDGEIVKKLTDLKFENTIKTVLQLLAELEEDAIEEKDGFKFVKYLGELRVRQIFKERSAGPLLGKFIEKKWKETVGFVFDCMMEQGMQDGQCYWKLHYEALEAPFRSSDGRTIFQELSTRAQSDLVDHDLMRLLTHRKWKLIGKKRFLFGLLYLLTLFCLTFTLVTSVAADDVCSYNSSIDHARAVFEALALLLVAYKLITELLQIKKSRLHYFYDPVNWIELSSSLVLLCVTFPLRLAHVKSHWYFFAAGYAAWVVISYKYAALIRPLFFQAQILIQVFKKDIPMFSILFLVINLAFTGSLYLVVHGDDNLDVNQETSSFGQIFFMGIRTLAEGQPVLEDYAGNGEYRPVSTIVIVVFLIIVVVTLLNMLIAQLSETIGNVNSTICRNYQVNLACTVAWMEINLPACCHKSTMIPTDDIKDANLRKILEPRESVMGKIHKNMENLVQSQTEIAKRVLDVKQSVHDTKQLLTEVSGPQLETEIKSMKRELRSHKRNVDNIGRYIEENRAHMRDMKDIVKKACEGILPETTEMDVDDTKARGELEIGQQQMPPVPDAVDAVDSPRPQVVIEEWIRFLNEEPPERILGQIESYILQGKTAIAVFPYEGHLGEITDDQIPLCIAAKKGYFHVVRKLLQLYPKDIQHNADKEKALKTALENKLDHTAALLVENMDAQDPERLRELFISQNREPAMISLSKYFTEDYKHFVTAVFDSVWNGNDIDTVLFENDSEGRPRTDQTLKNKSMFQILANSGETAFFSHRAVQFVIWKKWTTGGYLKKFIIHMVVYLISLLFITLASVLGVLSRDVQTYHTGDGWRIFFEVISLLSVIYTLVSEIIQLCRERLRNYKNDVINLAELFASSILISVLPVRYISVHIHWYFFAVGYFLWVMIMFKYAAVHRSLGTYAQSLYLIITRDILQFLCLFAIILIAFSGSFLLVLRGDEVLHVNNETSSFWAIAFTGVRAMADGQKSVDYYGKNGYGHFWSIFVMVLFLFVTIVILLNILIAQLSDTYTNIQGEAEAALWARKAKTIVRLETNLLYRCSCRYFKTERLLDTESTLTFQRKVPHLTNLAHGLDNRVEYLIKRMPEVETNVLGLRAEASRSKKILEDMHIRNIQGEVTAIKSSLIDAVNELRHIEINMEKERNDLKNEIETLMKKYSKTTEK